MHVLNHAHFVDVTQLKTGFPLINDRRSSLDMHTDLYCRGSAIIAKIDMRGVDEWGISVRLSPHALTVSAARPSRGRRLNARHERTAVRRGEFSRRIPLPEDVDPTTTEARYDKGTLTVNMPIA